MARNKYAWNQVGGDFGNPLIFGGIFTRDAKPEKSYCDLLKIESNDMEETRDVEILRKKPGRKNDYGPDSWAKEYTIKLPAKITVYRLDMAYADPLNESWVTWDDVLRFTGETRAPADMAVWERIVAVGDYYGWANFGDGDEFTKTEIRRMLRI